MRNEENKYYKSLQICEVVFHKQKLSNITNITKKTKPQNQALTQTLPWNGCEARPHRALSPAFSGCALNDRSLRGTELRGGPQATASSFRRRSGSVMGTALSRPPWCASFALGFIGGHRSPSGHDALATPFAKPSRVWDCVKLPPPPRWEVCGACTWRRCCTFGILTQRDSSIV